MRGAAEAICEIPRFARNDPSGQIASVTSFLRNDTVFDAFVLMAAVQEGEFDKEGVAVNGENSPEDSQDQAEDEG